MNDHAFAEQLSAWIDPSAVLQVARTYATPELWSEQLAMPGMDPRLSIIINEDAQRLMTGLDLHLYAISTAQHYGLPTMGLDVTGDLSVALFFALHQAQRTGRNVKFQRKTAGDPKSVLDFGMLPPAPQLFPERGQDLFGDYLERALERGLPSELKKYVEQLYWVVED